ncbi:hypothetical protein BGW36DRAFT_284468 [Talaromyces proteolyticus]|uniref:Calpain catalytic domain-containing protein n=1 Tax=Talaromyces proteolyticus TaxID=1131652 RepID=A0AAD4L3Q0_9EURO|nr:uncharacterized protein BGW36DRAFT_284468 [Talaromyces proteolyticus]KAH8706011.1 hypothetical protein BGW36DRAFT_284468 [Talaromyces proteolyticus]
MSDTLETKKNPNKPPQELVGDFWDSFITKKPGQVTSVFPQRLYANLLHPVLNEASSSAHNAAESYDAAAKECKEKVARIVRECTRTNEKFLDPDFDIESDKNLGLGNCLRGLLSGCDDSVSSDTSPEIRPAVSAFELRNSLNTLAASHVLGISSTVPIDVNTLRDFIGPEQDLKPTTFSDENAYFPGSVHRIDWIFKNPQFTVDGYSTTDIKQGANGDCWWLAAVATICNRQDLMEKICVARDAECGVYGYVFYRDGDWVSTVVDDNLYLSAADFDFYGDRYDGTGKRAREHRKHHQTGSEALYFAKCADPNETWLPLLEKAYAKIHGDYDAISGGWPGEAVEDLTGGVTTTIATNRVLSIDRLWNELINSDGQFVFAASALGTGWDSTRSGLALGHAYSILRAVHELDEEGNGVRLVLIRNPWGERNGGGIGEWNGPWSDGAKEWTPYWLQKLDHKFGDDGIFWMAYEDFLSTFMFVHRTRIFDDRWTVVQQWTRINVPWVPGYLRTKFEIKVTKPGPVVFVLSQLDKRYFAGLEGQYKCSLHFRLQDKNKNPEDYILLVRPVHSWEDRSVNGEIELEPGTYEVVPKILATRDTDQNMVEDVVKDWAERNPQKLRQVGKNYDIANSKVKDLDENRPTNLKKVVVGENKGKESSLDQDGKEGKSKKAGTDNSENKDTRSEKPEDAIPEVKLHSLDMLDGFRVNKKGQVLNEEGEPIGELDEGELLKCAGQKVNHKGEVCDKHGEILGKVRMLHQQIDKPSTDPKVEQKVKAPGSQNDEPQKDKGLDANNESFLEGKGKDEEEDDSKSDSTDTEENECSPWNAVCTIGLRVYAHDPDISIKLVSPDDSEDTSSRDGNEARTDV